MDRSDVITLVSTVYTKDANGVQKALTSKRDIFCDVHSITQTEFMEAGRNGLNPEYYFTVFFGDYQGERTLVYNGKEYGIYRTYQRRNDRLELYAERKGGTNGKYTD